MNKGIILNIDTMDDIKKINNNTKYINLNIDKVSMDVIDYFLINGKNYSYSETIDGRNGFIYVSYDVFNDSEKVITNILDSMPLSLTGLEKVRYIYISLGKILSQDINLLEDKNDDISFSNINTINNIWGSLHKRKTNDISISKLFMYLCNRCNIKNEIVINSIRESIANKVYINDNYIIVNLFNDIKYIQGGFTTHYFDKYNNDKMMDKKIKYIKEDYTDYYLDKELSNFNYDNDDVIYDILVKTQEVFNINEIGTIELSYLYKEIFDKYCPNFDVKINNFYVFDKEKGKEHFIVIEYNNKYYSFNYSKNYFINLNYDIIINNLLDKKIGLYNGEEFSIEKREVLL